MFNINYLQLVVYEKCLKNNPNPSYPACLVQFNFIFNYILKSVGNIGHISDYISETHRYCLNNWRIKQIYMQLVYSKYLYRVWMYTNTYLKSVKILSVTLISFVFRKQHHAKLTLDSLTKLCTWTSICNCKANSLTPFLFSKYLFKLIRLKEKEKYLSN